MANENETDETDVHGMRLHPQKPASIGGAAEKAWWYENYDSIDIVTECRARDGSVTGGGIVRIARASLEDWLKRSGKPERPS